MIRIEKTEIHGWEAAIRGMRNPMNSWEASDSRWCHGEGNPESCKGCQWYSVDFQHCTHPALYKTDIDGKFRIGPNDFDLMVRLADGGPDHGKFLRMITVTCDITAPLYWWKGFDTYKIGTVANSCSTMHKIHAKEFTLDDFSHEHLAEDSLFMLGEVIDQLNAARTVFNRTKDKDEWWQMIQLLPSSYNQRRTVQVNYAVLRNIYSQRKAHKLDEWLEFCSWAESLPYGKDLILVASK